jgi:hypothetical protein
MYVFSVNDLFLNSETLHVLLDELQIHFAHEETDNNNEKR